MSRTFWKTFPMLFKFNHKNLFSYYIVLITNISLGDSEKHEFSVLSFQVWENIKQLEIMKSQKNSTVHLFSINKNRNKNYTSALFFSNYFLALTLKSYKTNLFSLLHFSGGECIWNR